MNSMILCKLCNSEIDIKERVWMASGGVRHFSCPFVKEIVEARDTYWKEKIGGLRMEILPVIDSRKIGYATNKARAEINNKIDELLQ